MSSYLSPNTRRPWQSHIDMYRKIPTDLMEGTARGSIMSYISLFVMILLIASHTLDFWRAPRLETDLALDYKEDFEKTDTSFRLAAHHNQIRINFNITMLDLRCDYSVIDVVSVLGTDQNVTANITKHSIDGDGVRQTLSKGKNRDQKDIELYDTDIENSLEELHKDGEDAIPLIKQELELYKQQYEFLFVDFYASWCSHCVALHPTWETLGEVMGEVASKNKNSRNRNDDDDDVVEEDDDDDDDDDDDNDDDDDDFQKFSKDEYKHGKNVELPVVIAKVDCVDNSYVCNFQEQIRAYPTLRLFINGKSGKDGSEAMDYKGHRTITEMVDWLAYMEELHKMKTDKVGDTSERKLHTTKIPDRYKKKNRPHHHNKHSKGKSHQNKTNYYEWKESEHPGCELSGFLMLDRVPGNFNVLARSQSHDLEPQMTNTSHMVNTLSIGHPLMHRLAGIPPEVQDKLRPMNGNVYPTFDLHQSYHHYLKIVTVKTDFTNLYPITMNSQLMDYEREKIPEAKFVYDLSPISVHYRMTRRKWYEYVTSLFAIIGGIFTIIGMIESSIHSVVMKVKKSKKVAPGSTHNRYR